MKKNIELEKCRFMGDSSNNLAIYTTANGESFKVSQTDFITKLHEIQKYIKGGSKINLSDNRRVSYLIDYGTNKNQPKEMIKVTIDKENLEKGDVNALAIDSICRSAITIKKNNIKKKVMSGVAMTLVTAGLVGTMVVGLSYATRKEAEYQTRKSEEYVSQLNEERAKNGLVPIEEDSTIAYNDLDFTLTDETSSKLR